MHLRGLLLLNGRQVPLEGDTRAHLDASRADGDPLTRTSREASPSAEIDVRARDEGEASDEGMK